MKRLISTAAAIALTVGGVATAVVPSQAATKPQLTVGILAGPATFAATSGTTGTNGVLFQLPYDTLIYADAKGNLNPLLATKWAYSTDFLKLTLTLRKGVKFTDGTPFNAAAVLANIAAFRASSSVDLSQASSISSVKQGKDAYTVVISLNEQDPALLNSLSQSLGAMESPKAIGSALEKTTPVGSGPYMLNLAQSVADSSWVYLPNPNYWDKKVQTWSKITVKAIFDASAAVNAMTTGQVDMMAASYPNTLPALKAAGLKVLSNASSMNMLIIADRAGKMNPALGDVRIRQALNYALDRNVLIKVCNTGDGATPASSIFPETSKGYSKALDTMYPYDPEKAKALVASTGLKDIRIPTLDFSPFMPNCYAALTQMTKAVGIELYGFTPAQPSANIFAMLAKPEWPIYWFNVGTSSVDWTLVKDLISRDTTWNPLSFGTSKSDGLIVKIRNSTGAVQAKALLDLNTEITKNAWFVPFAHSYSFYVYNAAKAKVSRSPSAAVPNFPRMVLAK